MVSAFLRRDWAIARSYRVTFILETLGSLVGLVMFFYLGRLIDSARIPGIADLEQGYFAFAAIGLALLQVVQTCVSSFADTLRTEQTTGTLEAMLTTPTAPAVVVLAGSAYSLLEATARAALQLSVAVALFGVRLRFTAQSALVVLGVVCSTVVLFAALGLLIAAFTVVFKQGRALVGPLLLATSLLGGVYYPLDVLPGPLQALGSVNPFTIALDGLRAGLLRADADLGQLLTITFLAGLAMPMAVWVLECSVRRARRAGTLGQY